MVKMKPTRKNVVTPHRQRVSISKLENQVALLRLRVESLATGRLGAMETVIADLDAALRHAIARKPNAVLTQLVYQLKMTRVELAAVQEQLAANNVILERYARAPVLPGVHGVVGTA